MPRIPQPDEAARVPTRSSMFLAVSPSATGGGGMRFERARPRARRQSAHFVRGTHVQEERRVHGRLRRARVSGSATPRCSAAIHGILRAGPRQPNISLAHEGRYRPPTRRLRGPRENWAISSRRTDTTSRFARFIGATQYQQMKTEDLLIVMGGSMGVRDRDRPELLFLSDEIGLLRHRIEEDSPVLGVCLGAQLLAHAAGAHVLPDGRKTRRTPVLRWAGLPSGFTVRTTTTPSPKWAPRRTCCTGTATRSTCPRARSSWRRAPFARTSFGCGADFGCSFTARSNENMSKAFCARTRTSWSVRTASTASPSSGHKRLGT